MDITVNDLSDQNLPTTKSVNSSDIEQLDSFWLTVVAVLPFLGLLPLMVIQTYHLITTGHYRFAPLVWFAAVIIIAVNFRLAKPTRERFWIAATLCLTGCLIGLVAIWFFSPPLAQLALAITIMGWLLGQLGETQWTRILAISSLFIVTIPPPFLVDVSAIRMLQSFGASWTSSALDAFGILHLLDADNAAEVVSIKSRYFSLPISAVGGGLDSCFLLLGLAAVCLAARRHGYAATIVLLLSVPVWSLVYITCTETTLAIYGNAMEDAKLNLPIMTVRIIWLAIVLMLIVLFDIGLVAFTRSKTWLSQDDWLIDEDKLIDKPAIAASYSQPLARFGSLPVSIALLLAGIVSAWLIARNYQAAIGLGVIPYSMARDIAAEDAVPETVGNWNRVAYGELPDISRDGKFIAKYAWLLERDPEHIRLTATNGESQDNLLERMLNQKWRVDANASDRVIEFENVRLNVTMLREQSGQQAFVVRTKIRADGSIDASESVTQATIPTNIFEKLGKPALAKDATAFQIEAFYPTIAEQRQLDQPTVEYLARIVQNISDRTKAITSP
jgi:hypothetical protein